MVKVQLSPGEQVAVTLEGADGEFIIAFDLEGNKHLTVATDWADTSGRVGAIYDEDFNFLPQEDEKG